MLDSETNDRVRELAYARDKSKGQMVREAIAACYQVSLDDLPLKHRQARAAYRGGYTSIGRLARATGMHVLELRGRLQEHGILKACCTDNALTPAGADAILDAMVDAGFYAPVRRISDLL